MLPMRQRNSGIARGGARVREPRDHLIVDAAGSQMLELLTAAAKHERVATLQSHHREPPARVVDQHPLDPFLARTVSARAFADLDERGLAPRQCQYLG